MRPVIFDRNAPHGWEERGIGKHLYVLFAIHTRRCKIGRASDVKSRFVDLQNSGADDLILWAWAADCGKYEVDLHWHFQDHRLHGEWFSPEVTALIAATIPQQDTSSTSLARLARKRGRANQPACPGCGSRRNLVWKDVGRRRVAQCPKCSRYRHSIVVMPGNQRRSG